MRFKPMKMPRTSRQQRQARGKFWRPRTAVCTHMCDSCPFGSDRNLAAKVAELGVEETSPIVTKDDAINAAEAGMEFMCHSTLIHDLEAQVTMTPPSARLCKGLFMYRRGEI